MNYTKNCSFNQHQLITNVFVLPVPVTGLTPVINCSVQLFNPLIEMWKKSTSISNSSTLNPKIPLKTILNL